MVLASLEHMISDAQKQQASGGAAVYAAADVERDGRYKARPLLCSPYKYPDDDKIWRVVSSVLQSCCWAVHGRLAVLVRVLPCRPLLGVLLAAVVEVLAPAAGG